MKKIFSIKKTTITFLLILIILSSFLPIGIGDKLNISDDKLIINKQNILNYNGSVFSTDDQSVPIVYNNETTLNKNSDGNNIFSNVYVEGPWPMYCHDARHTGRSPFSTAYNLGIEKWRFDTIAECSGSPIIDKEDIIYIVSDSIFAVYPNGTIKWSRLVGRTVTAPTIDEYGILYFGTFWQGIFYAIYSNNGTVKWTYYIGRTYASPTVCPDGIIYAPATDNWNVIAFYPNGTVKWSFHANERVFSSPALGSDGTVYCTSYGSYLYALYPDNGTVKWQYHTDGYVRTSPCIADDGTIYIVSVNGVLHALFPNGTLKWQTGIDGGTSPTIGQDGTIYCGYHALYAVNPDGSVKWVFNPGNIGEIKEGTPCNSLDGTIYFGTYASNGGELIAVNPDGTERWRLHLATGYIMSAPCIGSDGAVYVGSWNSGPPYGWGFLHAINTLDPDAPFAPVIDGPLSGKLGVVYNFTFMSISPLGRDVYYWVEWGDNQIVNWAGPYASGEVVTFSHKFLMSKNYTIRARAKDTENLWGPWGEFEVEMTNTQPPSAPTIKGPRIGKAGVSYNFTFKAVDPEGYDLRYLIEWGDFSNDYWVGPYKSGEEVIISHNWSRSGIFIIRSQVKDVGNAKSEWAIFAVIMPRNKVDNPLLLRFLERFPLLERLLFLLKLNKICID